MESATQPLPETDPDQGEEEETVAQHGGEGGAEEEEEGDAFADRFLALEERLAGELMLQKLGTKVKYVYNPLSYALESHRKFLRTYLRGRKKVLFLGMNPGPWGMMQTGVPFGEIGSVRDFLALPECPVAEPARFHPKRPVTGFKCQRREVSGERLWGLFKDLCKTPENFFRHCFVHNHCPLGYLSDTGKNVTPVELKRDEREKILKICDDSLLEAIEMLGVDTIVGIGRYAVERAEKVLRAAGREGAVRVVFMNHPSPASASANRGGGWRFLAAGQLEEAGVAGLIRAPAGTEGAPDRTRSCGPTIS